MTTITKTDRENILLRNFVRSVVHENICQCGQPPFVDGNVCSRCYGYRLMNILELHDTISAAHTEEAIMP